MTTTFDPAADFLSVTDGLAAVLLRDRALNEYGEFDTITALRRAITQREADKSNGKYTTADVVFHLAISQVAVQPELGSWIVDDDGDWRVLEVAKQTLNARWRCICRNLAITAELDQRVVIQVCTYEKGDSGALEPHWENVAENVLAKVQLIEGERETEHNAKQTKRRATVFFASQFLLTTNHRILGADGGIYRVLKWSNPDRIDALFEVETEVTRWPLS